MGDFTQKTAERELKRAAGEVYVVPAGTRKIAGRAFMKQKNLKTVILPEGLQEIANKAFWECGITEIVIPASVRHIAQEAFLNCAMLRKVVILGENTNIEAGAFSDCDLLETIQMPEEPAPDELFHLRGIDFLSVERVAPPYPGCDRDEEFLRLAGSCAKGDVDAMYAFSEYFEKKSAAAADFYDRTANFWRYRAYIHENAGAKRWFQSWFAAHPGERLPSVLSERLSTSDGVIMGYISGAVLNQMGFLFFNCDREYYLSGLDKENVVEVFSYCGEDGPDEDGFGAETFYDWWYLDDNLTPVPGSQRIHSYSKRWKISGIGEEYFQHEHDIAAAAVRKRSDV